MFQRHPKQPEVTNQSVVGFAPTSLFGPLLKIGSSTICTNTDFSAEVKASGVKFCTAVHWRPRQRISYFGNFAPPEAPQKPKIGRIGQRALVVVWCFYSFRMPIKFARRVDVRSACVDIRQSPKTDVLVNYYIDSRPNFPMIWLSLIINLNLNIFSDKVAVVRMRHWLIDNRLSVDLCQ